MPAPLEHNPPDRWDEDAQYIAGYQEDEDFSDIDSDSSDITTRSMSTLNSLEVNKAARLEIQHHYMKLMIGSNYFGPVLEILQPHPTRRKRVLDVFTADGTWAQEMATEFPHVDFVSLDMIPLVPHAPRPNISFEVYDVYNGLAEPDASFDIVHARRTITQFRDYNSFLREIHRVLKPGGLILFGQVEIEVYEYTSPDQSTPNDPGSTLFPGPHVIQAKRSLPVMTHGMYLLPPYPGSSLWHLQPHEREMKFDDVQTYSPTVETACARPVKGFKDVTSRIHIYPTTDGINHLDFELWEKSSSKQGNGAGETLVYCFDRVILWTKNRPTN
ncbi:S-adenosyl-L-methionine-dependent methyltransferase [Rhizoctonia solani]|uniref:S-adenosyl-L-methionine-dependent methyltransferase n=1 Tax=Rhizoctonia solani TaxID=456999 RepID=A0A8H7M3X1_9AGAM|nr:S-adenosyl-L-methionine-dependent methyltransferase [Rhizoctonia solani]